MTRHRAVLLLVWLVLASHASAASLTMDPGVVVKFDSGSGLVDRSAQGLIADNVVFTSIHDDTVGGQTLPQAGAPASGDWLGLKFDRGQLRRSKLRFATMAVEPIQSARIEFSMLSNNAVGLAASVPTSVIDVEQSIFEHNQVAIRANGASPRISASILRGNTTFAVENLQTGTMLNARGNWWGHPSGPNDPIDNPSGQGDKVTRGVDYGQFLAQVPLLDCRIEAFGPTLSLTGIPLSSSRDISLRLACAGAVEARVTEGALGVTPAFVGGYTSLNSPIRSWTLAANIGLRSLHAQFRGPNGQTRIATMSIIYDPVLDPLLVVLEDPPIFSTVINNDTIAVRGSVFENEPISEVRFFANDLLLHIDSEPPYVTQWSPTSYPNYSDVIISMRARAMSGREGFDAATVSIRRPSQDTTPPVISLLTFDGTSLVDGRVLTGPGTFGFKAVDSGDGLADVFREVNGLRRKISVDQSGNFQELLTFANEGNGPISLVVEAFDRAGNRATVVRNVVLTRPPPPVPVILAPGNNAVVSAENVFVTGTAEPLARIQLYANNVPLSLGLGSADHLGRFVVPYTFSDDGSVALSVDASNPTSTTPRSNSVNVTLTRPPPAVRIVAPGNGERISADTTLSASVVGIRPGTSVSFYVNDQLLGTDNSAPFTWPYSIAGVPIGLKSLRVVARRASAADIAANSSFFVRPLPPSPPVFQPPFVAIELNASPALSGGTAPITITGRLRTTAATPAPVGNAPALLVLRQLGFDRRIPIVSAPDGSFSHTFTPLRSDAGVIQASAMHPDAKPFENLTVTGIAQFNVNRIVPLQDAIVFGAPMGFDQEVIVKLNAVASKAIEDVRIVARNSDQQGGQPIPADIVFDGGKPQTIPANGQSTFRVRFRSNAQVPRQGNLWIAAIAPDTGDETRARIRLQYRLFSAQPVVRPSRISVFTGVRRNETATDTIDFQNDGFVDATAIKFSLHPTPGNSLPSWLRIVSPPDIERVQPGQRTILELRASPGASVVDGVYQVLLRTKVGPLPSFDIPVSVAVAEAGEGRAQFKVINLFTGTNDADGKPILGVAGARVAIENESNPTIRATGTTAVNGEVLLAPIQPGRYRFRVSAPNHQEASGRITLRPGATTDEQVFIEYQTVSFTWSVTPTTIPSIYNLVLNATFQTNVPAPVLVLAPSSITIPDLAIGASLTGEFTLTNHGLIRAENLVPTFPQSDQYYRIEFLATLPTELEPYDQVVLPYRITKLAALPGEAAARSAPTLATGGGCFSWGGKLSVRGTFPCAGGVISNAGATAGLSRTFGGCGGGSLPTFINSGGQSLSGCPGCGANQAGQGDWGGSGCPYGDCSSSCSCAGGGCQAGPGVGAPPVAPPMTHAGPSFSPPAPPEQCPR